MDRINSEIDVNDLIKNIIIRVRVVGMKRFRIKLWICEKVLYLVKLISGCRIDVNRIDVNEKIIELKEENERLKDKWYSIGFDEGLNYVEYFLSRLDKDLYKYTLFYGRELMRMVRDDRLLRKS